MNKAQLKIEIDKLAKNESITFVDACKAFQTAAAKMDNEYIIGLAHELKMESVGM